MRSYVQVKTAGNCWLNQSHGWHSPFVQECFYHFISCMSNSISLCFSWKITFPLSYCSLPSMNTNFHHSGMIFFCLVVYTVATFIEVVPSVRSTPNGYEPFGMLKKRWTHTSKQVIPKTKEKKLQPPPVALLCTEQGRKDAQCSDGW